MSGNESGSGCARRCCESFRDCLNRVREIRFCLCCLCFLRTLDNHIFSSAILFCCPALTVASYFLLSITTSISTSAYCFVLVLCAAISRIFQRGEICIKKEKEQQRRKAAFDQLTRQRADGEEQLDVQNEADQGPVSGVSLKQTLNMSDNTEDNSNSTDAEFYRRLNELYRIWSILFWTIINSPCNFWSAIKSFMGLIWDTFLRQYIAVTVLILSISMLCVTGAFINAVGIMYCLSFIACSAVSLYFQRGAALYEVNALNVTEQQRLLDEFNREKEKDDQPAGNGAKNKNKASQIVSKTVMEPRIGSTHQVPSDFHHSDMHTPSNYNDNSAGPSRTPGLIFGENSEGPSSRLDPFPLLNYNDDPTAQASRTSDPHTSTRTDVTSVGSLEDSANSAHFSNGSFDSDEAPPCQFQARLTATAVKTFGAPIQIFGADSCRIFDSSDENSVSDESFLASGPSEVRRSASKVKTFEVSVEVHPESLRSINYSNTGSSSVEIASMASDESAQMAGSDLLSNIPYMDDDESSETTCSTHLDEESTKTEA